MPALVPAAADEEGSQLKKEELAAAGLKATEKDYAELERLKQQADMAEKRKAIGGDAPSAAAKVFAQFPGRPPSCSRRAGRRQSPSGASRRRPTSPPTRSRSSA